MRKDRKLLALGAELERAWSEERRLINSDATDAQLERACGRCSKLVRRIELARAKSIAGLRVKARAVAWCHSGKTRRNLFMGSTADIRIAGSIVADLLDLAA